MDLSMLRISMLAWACTHLDPCSQVARIHARGRKFGTNVLRQPISSRQLVSSVLCVSKYQCVHAFVGAPVLSIWAVVYALLSVVKWIKTCRVPTYGRPTPTQLQPKHCEKDDG